MRYGNQFIFLLVLFALHSACQSPKQQPIELTPAFYYWQTTFRLGTVEREALREYKIKKLYLRFFDVDWNSTSQQAAPKAVVQFVNKPKGIAIIPVVFITNQTLQRTAPANILVLAKNIADKISQIARQQAIKPVEIQLDCDWTQSTRDRYFALLRAVKKQISVPLSATIRLHQIKYAEQTGIPPTDRGMLMVYNMADWKRPETRNSIYDLDVARRYLSSLDQYPLPLDVVMPLFRWTVVYRNNRFLVLLTNLSQQQLRTQPFLQMQADTNRFVARQDTAALGLSIRKGDLFRAEACEPAKLWAGRQEVLAKIRTEKSTFALYHLDSTVLNPYNHAFLESLFRSIP
jgi:hypothetical protein